MNKGIQYLPSAHINFVRDSRYSERVAEHPPPSPGCANFSTGMECTPKWQMPLSVYSVFHLHTAIILIIYIEPPLSAGIVCRVITHCKSGSHKNGIRKSSRKTYNHIMDICRFEAYTVIIKKEIIISFFK
jgi:hypothetical protein